MTEGSKTKRLSILYLMHVPWGWIKQRPHFLAKYLNRHYDVTVSWRVSYRRNWHIKNAIQEPLATKQIYVLPLQRFAFIEWINRFLVRLQLKRALSSADLVWMTHPNWFECVGPVLGSGPVVIYDCMDDALEFPNIASCHKARQRMFTAERDLLARADITLVSSENLRRKLMDRYQKKDHLHVINNAVHLPDPWTPSVQDLPQAIRSVFEDTQLKKLTYIGTIEQWIDFDLVLDSVKRHPGILYIFVGPLDTALPKHERIVHVPAVEHRHVQPIMELADVLIMPFVVNELIESVDPVKLYEYIRSCKPVISIATGETRKFDEYVHTYADRDDYDRLLRELVRGDLRAKRSCDDCRSYAAHHTWDARGRMVQDIIEQAAVDLSPTRSRISADSWRGAEERHIAADGPAAAAEDLELPNFFIVGAAKAGTTSLYEYLAQHPQAYMSPVKEPNYFSSDIDITGFGREYSLRMEPYVRGGFHGVEIKKVHMAHINDWDDYCRLFEGSQSRQARGEASVSYLYSRVAAGNIKDRIPGAKIIMILRNPVDRAFSHYLMDLRDGATTLPFRQAIDEDLQQKRKGWGVSHLYVELGMYYEQVLRYLELFDRRNVKIYFYEEFKDYKTLVRDIYGFLGIEETFEPDLSRTFNVARVPVSARINYLIKNSSLRMLKGLLFTPVIDKMKELLLSKKKHAEMTPEDRKFLAGLFRDDVKKLERLLQRDLSGWLK